jgi:hypothetical protein
MNESVTVKSPNGNRFLAFSEPEGDYFSVALGGSDCSARRRVYAYKDQRHLVALFASMAEEWRGWEGEKSWCSIEGEFELHATSDSLGHVALRVVLTNANEGPSEPWRVESTVMIEAGRLEGLRSEVADLFRRVNG